MLIVTHDCNLRCSYCYETHKSASAMDLTTATAIVARELAFLADSPDFDELEIDFMGGEPLLQFELIRALVERVVASPQPVPYIFFMTTNGTLLDERMKSWFRQHREHLWLSLSLDGAASTQRTNRGRLATSVDLDFFKENWPEQECKMTISRAGLRTLASDILYVYDHGLKVEASIASGIDWTEADANELAIQLRLLSAYYLAHPELKAVDLLSRNLGGVLNSSAPEKYCGTGTHMVAYDVDGRAYPCHMFSPLVLDETQRQALRRVTLSCGSEAIFDSECAGCDVRQLCPTCYGMNLKFRGDVAKRDRSRCAMVWAVASAACHFQLKTLPILGETAALDAQTAYQVKSLLRIYDLTQRGRAPGTGAAANSLANPHPSH